MCVHMYIYIYTYIHIYIYIYRALRRFGGLRFTHVRIVKARYWNVTPNLPIYIIPTKIA